LKSFKPLVSIITPSYNSFPYIKDTVESVRSQDYPHIEHLMIDGNSTDGTREFLQQQTDLTWISEPDRGQSHALNKGFRNAKGEIIGWLNADDTYQPGAVSRAVGFLNENEHVDLIYSDLNIIDEKGEQVGVTRARPYNLEALLFSNPINQPTVFMRREVIDNLNGLDEKLHYVMDRELWLRVGLAGYQMEYLDGEVLANFRIFPGTKSFEQTPNFRLEWIEVLEQVFKKIAFNLIPDSIKHRAIQEAKAQYHIALMIQSIEKQDRYALVKHLFKAISHNKQLILNRGMWFFVYKGLMGQEINRLRKFQSW
jgi:glycosyltransferase involved in cell wall biosynthesis